MTHITVLVLTEITNYIVYLYIKHELKLIDKLILFLRNT